MDGGLAAQAAWKEQTGGLRLKGDSPHLQCFISPLWGALTGFFYKKP